MGVYLEDICKLTKCNLNYYTVVTKVRTVNIPVVPRHHFWRVLEQLCSGTRTPDQSDSWQFLLHDLRSGVKRKVLE